MGYRVKGTLKLPDGSPASNAEIEFISRKNFSPLVQELKSNILCGPTGAYDVTLEFGEYAVLVYPGGTYPAALGTIILATDTVVGQDLPTLLQQAGWQPATPEYIQQISQWLAEANNSATNSSASASAAKASETNAKASELAAESDRAEVASKSANVDAKHSEVVSKAAIVDTKTTQVIAAESVAVAAADTASQKAADAATHEASSLDAATRAENAALSMVGAIIDGGECDLSGGVYPQPVSASGITYSTVWFVAVGGLVSGIAYDIGDQLRYTTANSGYYFRVDAKDEVYSVNGEKGAVTVTPEKIGAEVSGTASQLILQHESKPNAHEISGVNGLMDALNEKEDSGAASSAVASHAAKSGAHQISGVDGLQESLDSKFSANNKPAIADVDGLSLALDIATARISELEEWPQSGSSVNGRWVKHRDGTMTCTLLIEATTKQVGVTNQGIYYGAAIAATPFPVPFVGIPDAVVSFLPIGANTFWSSYKSPQTPTNWPSAYPFSELPFASSIPILISLSATGRWK